MTSSPETAWLWWGVETSAATAVLALAASLLERPLMPRPGVRHVIWCVVLVRFLTPPVIGGPFPGVAAWLAPERLERPADEAAGGQFQARRPAGDAVSCPRPVGPPPTLASPAGLGDGFADPRTPQAVPGPATELRAAVQAGRAWSPGGARVGFSWGAAALMVWLAGSAWTAVRLGMPLRRLSRCLREAREPSPELAAAVQRIAKRLGVRPPPVVMVAGLNSPCLFCLGRQRLLWPESLAVAATTAVGRGLLAHELAHLQRRDQWWLWIDLSVRIAWWWNPLAEWVRRRASDAAEQACDAIALQFSDVDRGDYAKLMLKICHRALPALTPVLGLQSRSGSALERRISMLLLANVNPQVPRLALLLAGLVVAASCPAAGRADQPPAVAVTALDAIGSPAGAEATTRAVDVLVDRMLEAESSHGGRALVLMRRGAPGRPAILRLTAMYYTALADGRTADAAALAEALTALGTPPTEPGEARIRDWVRSFEPPLTVPDFNELSLYADVAFRIRVTGTLGGTVWGSDIFTDDSSLGAAAVHAGLLAPGETAELVVTLLGPQESFGGSSRHGVTSYDYGPWNGSFQLAPLSELPDAPCLVAAPLVSGSSPRGSLDVRLSQLPIEQELRPGLTLLLRLTGDVGRSVWGSKVYTTDSNLPAAAVHAGVLKPGQTGVVKIVIEEGRSTYSGSTRHGVTTSSWDSYPLSFRFAALPLANQDAVEADAK